jgi:hypothetical protein
MYRVNNAAIWTIYRFMYPHHFNKIKHCVGLWSPDFKILKQIDSFKKNE